MVISQLLIPHQHRSYCCIDKTADTISRYSSYSRPSKYIYRQPLNSLKFNRQPSKRHIFRRQPSKATPPPD